MLRALVLFACMAFCALALPLPRNVFDFSGLRNSLQGRPAEIRSELETILLDLDSRQVAAPLKPAKMARGVDDLKRNEVLLQMSIERCGTGGC